MTKSRRSFPLGLLGALGLIVWIEGTLARLERPQLSTPWALDWQLSAQAAGNVARSSQILCFGDSLTKFGVIPAVLSRETGLAAYNLAVNVGHPSSSLFLLERALKAGARPEVILVNFTPHLLSSRPQDAIRQWPELIQITEAIDLIQGTRDPRFAAHLAIGKLLPSARTRFEVRETVLAALRDEWSSHAYISPGLRRNWRTNRGAQIMPPTNGKIDDQSMAALLYPSRWTVDRTQERYVRRFLETALQAASRVILIIPPTMPEVQAKREQIGADARYEAFLLGLQREFPRLEVADARHSSYGPDVHVDPIHLDVNGARAFSASLGRLIAKPCHTVLAQERWKVLPRYEPSSSSEAFEDLNASRLAVQTGRGVAR